MKEEYELEREIIFAEANGEKFKHLRLLVKYRIMKSGRKIMKNVLERLKSPVVCIEIVVLIVQLLRHLGVYDMPNEALEIIQDAISYGFYIFAGINNPTTRNKF